MKPSYICYEQTFHNVNKNLSICKSQLTYTLQFLRGACGNTAAFVTFPSGQLMSFQVAAANAALKTIATITLPPYLPFAVQSLFCAGVSKRNTHKTTLKSSLCTLRSCLAMRDLLNLNSTVF